MITKLEVEKLKVLFFSYRKYVKKLFLKREINSSNILIVFWGSLGDATIALDALREIEKIFPSSKGYSITMVTLEFVGNYLKAYGNMEEIRIITVDANWQFVNCRRFKHLFEVLNKKTYGTIYFFQHHSIYSAICAGLTYGSAVLLTDDSKISCHKDKILLGNKIYTDIVRCSQKDMVFEHYKQMIWHMGNHEYVSKIADIKCKRNIKNPLENARKYAVVAVGANNIERRIPISILVRIIRILDRSNMKIVLVGEKQDIEYANLARNVALSENIIDMVGKTNFDMFLKILEDSAFVVSGDSGPAHLGTSLGKRVLCLSGYWEQGKFFPYIVEDCNEKILPKCVKAREMPKCYGCRQQHTHTKSYYACVKAVKQGGSYLCLQNIEIEDVEVALNKIIMMYENDIIREEKL